MKRVDLQSQELGILSSHHIALLLFLYLTASGSARPRSSIEPASESAVKPTDSSSTYPCSSTDCSEMTDNDSGDRELEASLLSLRRLIHWPCLPTSEMKQVKGVEGRTHSYQCFIASKLPLLQLLLRMLLLLFAWQLSLLFSELTWDKCNKMMLIHYFLSIFFIQVVQKEMIEVDICVRSGSDFFPTSIDERYFSSLGRCYPCYCVLPIISISF